MTPFEKFCLSLWLKIVTAAVCAVIAGCGASIANAQQRGGTMTISPDGAVAVSSAPVVRSATVRRGYPVRGNHWTYPGSSRSQLIYHLQTGEHAGKFPVAWLNSLSYQELLSLHDDDHEHRVKLSREERKATKELGRMVYGTRDGKHPGPVGASIRGWLGDPRYRAYCPTGNCPYR